MVSMWCLSSYVCCSQFARPHHTETAATTLYSKDTLLMWLARLRHMFHILEWHVLWPPWSGPPPSHESICMLHLSLDVLMFHGLTELQIHYILTYAVQVQLRYFNFDSLVYLFIVLMFLAWLLGMWVSTWRTFRVRFSIQAVMSYHNAAAQMSLPLCCKMVFNCCNHLHRALATIQESV